MLSKCDIFTVNIGLRNNREAVRRGRGIVSTKSRVINDLTQLLGILYTGIILDVRLDNTAIGAMNLNRKALFNRVRTQDVIIDSVNGV